MANRGSVTVRSGQPFAVYFFFFLPGSRWLNALAAAVLEALLVRPSRSTLLAALPALTPVFFVAISIHLLSYICSIQSTRRNLTPGGRGTSIGAVSKLPDYLKPDLKIVFCGTAAGNRSAERGHYYAGPGNEFWGTLFETGLIPKPLEPDYDYRVLEFGIGLTDLAKNVAQSNDQGLREHYDFAGFIAKIAEYAPAWVAFHGKTAAQAVARHLGQPPPSFGRQSWEVETSKVFVVPSMSGSNRDPKNFGGKARRQDWFAELGAATASD